MDSFLKCGEFAALCGTTKNTLIHYDRLGLLSPAYVTESGYRCYLPSQRYLFSSIRALCDAGLSLEEVGSALTGQNAEALIEIVGRCRSDMLTRMARLRVSLERLDELSRQARYAEAERLAPLGVRSRPKRSLALFGVSATGREAYFAAHVLKRDIEVVAAISEATPLASLAPYGGICSGAASVDEEVRYNDLFYVLPEEAEYAGASSVIEAGNYAVLSYDGPFDGRASAHRELLRFVESEGLRLDVPRYEIASFKLFDSVSKNYRCTIEMKAEKPLP